MVSPQRPVPLQLKMQLSKVVVDESGTAGATRIDGGSGGGGLAGDKITIPETLIGGAGD